MKYKSVISYLLLTFLITLFIFGYSKEKEHIILPGDQLIINVWGTEEELTKEVVVRSDGKIFYPWVGELKVEGLTFKQTADLIKKGLSKYFKNFEVVVGLAEAKPFISILGEVTRPGNYPLTSGLTVMEAISLAGGLTERALPTVKIIRGNQKVIDIDLDRILTKNDLSQNIILHTGDILYVGTKVYNKVTVLGQVVKPGEYTIGEGWTILEAIIAAGGLQSVAIPVAGAGGGYYATYHRPGIFQITVRRGGEEVYSTFVDPTTLQEVIEKKEKSNPKSYENIFLLSPGDVLLAKEIRYAVAILGQVKYPYIYEFRKGDKITDVIALAGGFIERPDLKRICLVRKPKEGEKPKITYVDLEQVLRKGDITKDLELQDRDIIYVPARHRLITFDEITSKIGRLLGIWTKPWWW